MQTEQQLIEDRRAAIWWDSWHALGAHRMQIGRPKFSGNLRFHWVTMAEHESRCRCEFHIFKCSCGFEVKDTPYYATVKGVAHFREMTG